MQEAKEIVDLKKVVEGQKAPARKKIWRFKKIDHPNKVKLPNGDKIEFRLITGQDGGFLSYSLFDTEDEKLANALMEVAKAKNQAVISEGIKFV